MLTHEKHVKQTIRVFVRDVPGLSAEKQEASAADFGHVVQYGPDQREQWVRSLGPGQTGGVWRLSLLAVPSGVKNNRPSSDFTHIAVELARRVASGARLIEIETGVTSDDWPAMQKAFRRAADQIARGRRLSSMDARKRGEIGAKIMSDRSAANVLKRPEVAPHAAAVKAIWRSAEYPHRDAAAEAINAYMRERNLPPLGSPATMYRVFGERGRRKDAKKPVRQSWVYFVRHGTSKRIKIGRAINVERRMKSLAHPLMPALKLLATMPGGKDEEREMHRRFAEHRINGEWFMLEGELAKFVASLRKR